MFGFLKNKLKEAISKFSKKAEEEAKVEETTESKEKIKKEPEKEFIKKAKEEKQEKGFFAKLTEKLTTKKIDDKQFEDLFYDLELALLENNVALEVIDKIKEDLKVDLVNVPLKGKIEDLIKNSLKDSLEEILKETNFDLINEIKNKKERPYSIVFVGINGSGKTTTIAKLAYLLTKNNLKCVLVAADTFRAASIQQLEEHSKNLNVKLIKHDYGADPAAVSFDGVKYARSHNLDVVLIDTAGRQHSNKNLMEEMKKIIKVVKPDLKVFVGESIAGNDVIEQIKEFNNSINIDSIILAKADVDEKGGAAISVSYVSQKPVLYLGNGQKYSDLEKFNKDKIISDIGVN
ncbi:MAG: signal recognition particle-docking protein FtsY [Nanoarchaeota archaeon]